MLQAATIEPQERAGIQLGPRFHIAATPVVVRIPDDVIVVGDGERQRAQQFHRRFEPPGRATDGVAGIRLDVVAVADNAAEVVRD